MAGVPCRSCGRIAPDAALTCPTCGAWLEAVDASGLAKSVAGALGTHYRVEEEIGRGGYAVVFRVRDLRLERDLAAKALNPELAGITQLAERFRREAKTAAGLNHPNIVPIYFVGGDPAPCYVMPLIAGETLAGRLRREGQLAMAVVLGIARDIAAALDYAHAAGVIHRDVKPDNIMIEFATGRSMLTDFGIAKALAGDSTLTASGVIIGTPHYMSPEQAAGERTIDHRTDVYSLGIVIYEMLAGGPPFGGESAHSIFAQHMGAEPPSIVERRPDLREPVEGVLRTAMAKDPNGRFDSAADLVRALERAHGRASLRRPGGSVIERETRDDVRLFRTIGTATGSASAALRDAADVAAMGEAVNAIMESIRHSVEMLDLSALLQSMVLLNQRREDPRPALRQPVRDAFRRMADDERLVEALAVAWRGGDAERQNRVEQVMAALLPTGAGALMAVARRAKSAEFFLLADRVGAIDEMTAGELASSESPAVAQAFGVALRESARPRETIEHWLALLARHPRAEVRLVAVETAAAHGAGLSERVARLVLADPEPVPRRAAVRALGASRRREALPDLARLLEIGGREDQCAAAEALGVLGLPEAVPILERVFARRRLFKVERGTVQQAAARALAALPGGAGTAALARLIGHPDPEVRRIATCQPLG